MSRTTDSAAVVGAGPCGVAAAVQLRRSGFPTLLFECRDVGGLLHNANLVENYPGFSSGITGPRLCRLLDRHLRSAGIEPIFDTVLEIVPQDGGFLLQTGSGREFQSKTVVIATGTRPKTGILTEEKELAGKRIFYEVRDVLSLATGKRAAILGAGDAAHDYALNLASKGFEVSLVQRSPPKCLPLLRERISDFSRISVMKDTTVTGCREVDEALELDLKTGSETRVQRFDLLLIACGRLPRDELTRPLRGGNGELTGGIYAGGDLIRGSYRQTGIAVGDGLRAAMAAARRMAADV